MSSLPTNLKWILSIATEKSGNIDFLDTQGQLTPKISSGIWLKFELIQAFMHVLITCKYQKDCTLNSRDKVETASFPLLVYGVIF